MGQSSTGGGTYAATGMPGGGQHAGTIALHALLPGWLQILGVAVFAAIAFAHLRHLTRTGGQRRPWHACHVLMATSMIFMYAPGLAADVPGITTFWRAALAVAGLIAALWALWGGAGRVNPVWSLTALDLGAMLYMWSPAPSGAAMALAVTLYLLTDAGLWTFDAYRSFERAPSLLRWLPVADPNGGTLAVPTTAAGSDALLGDLDISPSMVVMTLGMAYMVLAMQLIR